MYYRHEYVRENVAMTLNDTFRVDLPKQGFLSSLLIRLSGDEISGLGQGAAKWRLMDFISKIAILANGSTIIKSLDMSQADALIWYDEGVPPLDRWRNYASNTQFANCLINFGRLKGDPQIGLDLSRYQNVEFQLTNTATASFFSGLNISILACYLEDIGPSPFVGVMRTEVWRQWTTVSDEIKYHELDVEYPIRRIMLQGKPDVDANFLDKTQFFNLMDDVELALDTGRVRLWKGGIDDLATLNYYNYGRQLITAGFPYQLADQGVEMGIGLAIGAVAGAGSQSGAVATTFPTIESARTDSTQKFENYNGDNPRSLFVIGASPFSTVMFRFDYQDDPSTWLDPAARRQVLLNIHTRSGASYAGGTNSIILDRFVRY